MKINFLGAAKKVTGSCYMIEAAGVSFLVDCGLYQGSLEDEALNSDPFEFNPHTLDFMILTHCHIDHSGRIPLLVKNGFTGRIFCTRPTASLTDLLLKDSGSIQEEEAVWENKKRQRAGLETIKPLYTVDDAIEALQYLNPVEYGMDIAITDRISVRFRDAGHLLGSAFVELTIKEDEGTKQLVFSGDLGTGNNPMLKMPESPTHADYIIMESTYGNKLHNDVETRNARLAALVDDTLQKGGTVLIPSFAVGRTQEIIFQLKEYYKKHDRLDDFHKIPIYIDSPMAVSATKIYETHHIYMKPEISQLFATGNSPLQCENITYVSSIKDSASLNGNSEPKVIVSASGMCEAGRIKHHLKHNLWKANTTVIFVGYQGEGTLGRAIQGGMDRVEILGETIKINARIVSIEGFSGHADCEDLLNWLGTLKQPPTKILLTHGEIDSIEGLKHRIETKYGYEVMIPNLGDAVVL